MPGRHPKRQFLEAAGALNPHPARVGAPLFERHRFFDPLDKVQVKYEMLRAHAVDGETAKAAALAGDLEQLGYSAEYGPSAKDPRTFLVNGWTAKMPMDEPTVVAWALQMCELGFRDDCDFDGWGTDPTQ